MLQEAWERYEDLCKKILRIISEREEMRRQTEILKRQQLVRKQQQRVSKYKLQLANGVKVMLSKVCKACKKNQKSSGQLYNEHCWKCNDPKMMPTSPPTMYTANSS